MRSRTLVTGAAGGLGATFARIAAAEGRDLILSDRDPAALGPLAAELRHAGARVEIHAADLRDPDAAETLWRAASEDGPVRILVNNAGLAAAGPFGHAETAAREIEAVAVNVAGFTRLLQLATWEMRGGGRVLNAVSLAAMVPGPGMAVHFATQSYALSLSLAVARESPHLTVTALCPGPTDTGFLAAAGLNAARLGRPFRPAEPETVAWSGWRAMMAGHRIATPGLRDRMLALGLRLAPRAVAMRGAEALIRRLL
ncbi:SDR family NAD(P)-dependent oxidoreductase [Palleronia sediminis]|uniref:SDR family NAD(P)-dependent oxidoreductase n=1 Tax=Palleronia sediminis TaxID=2547833 RepID=A0A4R6ADQ8_9RHOB|nr:SDR family NAD(P)-dependent oxidoreductase [Palleronia sediminis]TDL79566.1 SDR family NAD(P)-dependent oxidoreductase [Palleronia sediminis]